MLIATNDSAGDVARLDDSASPAAAVKPRNAVLSEAERTRRRRVREEKQRIADAKMQAYYSDEDCEKLAEFRGHWANELPPDAERVTLIVMIEGPHGDCHSLIDRVMILPEGGIDRVMRDALSLADKHDVCRKASVDRRSEKADRAHKPAKLTSARLPADVRESIDELKGGLLARVLGERIPVTVTIGTPNFQNDLIDREIMKVVAVSDRPDAFEIACAKAIELAKAIDPGAALSDDLKG